MEVIAAALQRSNTEALQAAVPCLPKQGGKVGTQPLFVCVQSPPHTHLGIPRTNTSLLPGDIGTSLTPTFGSCP